MSKPQNFHELFAFYYQEVKPIYTRVTTDGTPPTELLFEVTAAFDHLSRHWAYQDTEAETVSRTAGHLKRATFDAYKIIHAQTADQYRQLAQLDLSIIDNGAFEKNLHDWWVTIREQAIKARLSEGNSRSIGSEQDLDAWSAAFDQWKEVFWQCQRFERDFYLNPHVDWAKRRTRRNYLREIGLSFIIGVGSGIVATLLVNHYV